MGQEVNPGTGPFNFVFIRANFPVVRLAPEIPFVI